MTDIPLMEVVRIALDELECSERYHIIDAEYVQDGWCARLARTDKTEVSVCVNGQQRGQELGGAVDLFKVRMEKLGLV